jgi:hypothetical protein
MFSNPNRSSLTLACATALVLFGGRAAADQYPFAVQPSGPGFQVAIKNEEVVRGVNKQIIQRVWLTTGTNVLLFMVPPSFRVDASVPNRITLSSSEGGGFLGVRLVSPPGDSGSQLQTDTCRSLALGRFPGAKVTGEFSEFAANRSGPAFDLTWSNTGGSRQSARLVFISTRLGILEFSLLSEADKFDQFRSYFTIMLSSVCNNEGGKIQIPSAPGNS